MPSNPEGLRIARERIAAEKLERTGFLDLGRLGLQELPEELFELEHLHSLNLGIWWTDETRQRIQAEATLGGNQLDGHLSALYRLPCLRNLSLAEMPLADLEPLRPLTQISVLDCSQSVVSDLSPLSGLVNLTSLNCSSTDVRDLSPLSGLVHLISLDCSYTDVSDLSPLSGLVQLTSLDCRSTRVRDLSPLSGLVDLTSLDCGSTRVRDLSPLSGLVHLISLDCGSTRVRDLSPLSGLVHLTSLNCESTGVSDLSLLSGLVQLTSLECSFTGVSDLSPLSGLVQLTSLSCSDTGVSDLSPLSGLVNLTSLDCSGTDVSDLSALSGLVKLTFLECSFTGVSDLSPLLGLVKLVRLRCRGNSLSLWPVWWLDSPALRELKLFQTRIPGIPAEILGQNLGDNCLDRVRAHLRDLGDAPPIVSDVKALVLGNGRIGKTQICRRLRGETYDSEIPSTHGITVTSTDFDPDERSDAIRLNLWDFGGQDLYHGTHGLFLQTRSLFVVVWTPLSENASEHQHGGMTFRNHPLSYWLDYIRHFGGERSPVVIVQNQCERPEDDAVRLPVADELLGAFPFRKSIQYSARNNRGRAALDDALRDAVHWLRDEQGPALIGPGRLKVKRRLEALRDADAAVEVAARKYRTIPQAFFRTLCDEAGQVSDPDALLDYLHHAGVVFHRKGLFDDQILLDQAWALEAIYAVFHRERCYRPLRQSRGRFTRSLLDALVWGHFSPEEQNLFLSLMTSCGVCFVHRRGDSSREIEAEYIAPDFLPDRAEVNLEIEAQWRDDAPTESSAFDLPFLHPGVMRGLVAQLGQRAGLNAIYWKDGVCLYESTTRSHALITLTRDPAPNAWRGSIEVATQGDRAATLLDSLMKWVEHALRTAGCRAWTRREPREPQKRHHPVAPRGEPEDSTPSLPPLNIAPPPRSKCTFCVSYAWNDASVKDVDALCSRAQERGIEIIRDRTHLGLGGRISKFMTRLGKGDRVFVILSDKYLKSPYCMFELFEVWRNAKQEGEVFLSRVRVYRHADAAMMTPSQRLHCARHWRDQFDELDAAVREYGPVLLGEADFRRYRLMQQYANQVGDILAHIADTLLPRDLAELAQYGFEEDGDA